MLEKASTYPYNYFGLFLFPTSLTQGWDQAWGLKHSKLMIYN